MSRRLHSRRPNEPARKGDAAAPPPPGASNRHRIRSTPEADRRRDCVVARCIGGTSTRREVGITDERFGVFVSDACDKPSDEAAHRFGAVPAYDVGRDLVADEVAEDTRVAPTVAHPGGYSFPNVGLGRSAVEKCNVLRPRKSDENLQT